MEISSKSNLTRGAMLAALCAVLTMSVRIPCPLGGYLNLGDCGVLLSGWLLGPVWGAAAAGLGSSFADILGYPFYAPATFVIKALMAACSAWVWHRLKSIRLSPLVSCFAAGLVGELIMVFGYYLFESLFLGLGAAAAANLPFNLLQGCLGILSALFLAKILWRL